MTERTAAEAKAHNIEKMGQQLGEQYSALWQELTWLYLKWGEYVELFGAKPSRVDLLNRSAPLFFRLIQDALWEDVLLHISRLTDSPKSTGKENLTICNLPNLALAATNVPALVEEAKTKSGFCRDWRNRRIAHRDLKLALEGPAVPLEPASRLKVKDALDAIAAVLNEVDAVYMDSQTFFEGLRGRPGGALSLLYVVDDGVRAEVERSEKLKQGRWQEVDLGSRRDL